MAFNTSGMSLSWAQTPAGEALKDAIGRVPGCTGNSGNWKRPVQTLLESTTTAQQALSIFFLHDGGAAAEIARRADFPIPAPNDDVILALASAHAAALIVAAAHAAPAIAVTVRADTDGGPVRPTGPDLDTLCGRGRRADVFL